MASRGGASRFTALPRELRTACAAFLSTRGLARLASSARTERDAVETLWQGALQRIPELGTFAWRLRGPYSIEFAAAVRALRRALAADARLRPIAARVGLVRRLLELTAAPEVVAVEAWHALAIAMTAPAAPAVLAAFQRSGGGERIIVALAGTRPDARYAAVKALARFVNGSRRGGDHVSTLAFLATTTAALVDVLDAADPAKRNNILRVLPEFARECRAHRLLADKGAALRLVLWLRAGDLDDSAAAAAVSVLVHMCDKTWSRFLVLEALARVDAAMVAVPGQFAAPKETRLPRANSVIARLNQEFGGLEILPDAANESDAA